ncbi:hypothetical protein PQX77_003010 [Marasmius sp. AFHP31]|nr:hypothetical protein PQX77_003010 [Marasmius sp. AFHP31]
MARLNDFLRNAFTKGVTLQLMGDFQRAYQDDATGFPLPIPLRLLDHLVSYLFRNIPGDLEKYPPHLRKELNEFGYFGAFESSTFDEIPYLLTSQEGLFFLRSLNETIHERSYAHLSSQIARWLLGLKCVAHLNDLPLDHFAVRESQHLPGTSEASPGGDASASPPDKEAVDREDGLTGNIHEDHFTPIGPSTSAEEGARDEISVG